MKYYSPCKWGVISLSILLAGCHPSDKANKAKAKINSKPAAATVNHTTPVVAQAVPATSQKVQQLIRQHMAKLFGDDDAVVIGNPNGSVTLVEFYDYQCIHCRDAAISVFRLIKDNPELRVVLRPLPIRGHYSILAAKSVMAAQQLDPNKAFAFHERLIKEPLPFTVNTIPQAAKAVGYDSAKLYHLAQTTQFDQAIQANRQLAFDIIKPAMGVVATPVNIIGPTDIRSHYAPISFLAGAYSAQALQGPINAVKKGVCTPSTCD